MANFTEDEKKIYDSLHVEDKRLLLNHGLQKILYWAIILITLIVSFLQVIPKSEPVPYGYLWDRILWYVIGDTLWVFGFLLIWGIVFVINKFFISYENQLIWEYNFPDV